MRWRDVALAVVLGGLLAVDTTDAEVPWLVPLLAALPLTVRGPAPLVCVASLCAGFTAYSLIWSDPDSALAMPPLLLAAYSAGAHPSRRRALLGAAALAGFAISVGFQGAGKEGDIVFVAILTGLPWVAGLLARDYTDRAARLERLAAELEAEQREHERLALAAERTRIAAELNDAVAHAVSAMTMQANAAAGALASDPEAANRALGEVQRTGREAIGELRRMLGILRAPLEGR